MSFNKICIKQTRLSTAFLVLWQQIPCCYWIYKQKETLTDSLGNKYLCDCLCSCVWTADVCSVQCLQFAEGCTVLEVHICLDFFFKAILWLLEQSTVKCICCLTGHDFGCLLENFYGMYPTVIYKHFASPSLTYRISANLLSLFYSIYWCLLNPSADYKWSAARMIICFYNSNILFIICLSGTPSKAELFAEQWCGRWQYSGAVLLNF